MSMPSTARVTAAMKRVRRGGWVGVFPVGDASPVAVARPVQAHFARIERLFSRSEVESIPGHLRVLVQLARHVPGRG